MQSIDGTDFLASYRAMSDAVAYARARKGPALVHAKVIRPYSHSLSDDEKLYKTSDERAEESTRDPIVKLAELLKAERLATDDDLAAIRHEVDREVNDAAERARARAEADARHRRALRLLARRRSHVRRLRHARRRPKASPTPWSRPSTAR